MRATMRMKPGPQDRPGSAGPARCDGAVRNRLGAGRGGHRRPAVLRDSARGGDRAAAVDLRRGHGRRCRPKAARAFGDLAKR
jgi:hypothetical protein